MPKEDATRIFFATDVHGSEITFRKFTNAAKFYRANVLVLGGDVTGKTVVPIAKQADGTYNSSFLNQQQRSKNDQELKDLIKKIENSGSYWSVMEQQEAEALKANPEKVDELFRSLMRERLVRWVQLAEERLKGTNTVCYMTGGNDDSQEVIDELKETEHVKNPDGKSIQITGLHEMASLGWSNITPWDTPRECNEDELNERIEKMIGSIHDMSNAVFNFHVPPIDSVLDDAPKLDQSVYPPKPITAGGQIVYFGAGSKSVRSAIEKYQPLLGLHGHIHESRGTAFLGRTLCINPGSDYGEGVLRGVVVELSDKKVIQYQLTSG
jgi:Icc-related predicted phosphoesterase